MPQTPFGEPLDSTLEALRPYLENTYSEQQEFMFVWWASLFIYALISLVITFLVPQAAFEVDSIMTTFNLLNF